MVWLARSIACVVVYGLGAGEVKAQRTVPPAAAQLAAKFFDAVGRAAWLDASDMIDLDPLVRARRSALLDLRDVPAAPTKPGEPRTLPAYWAAEFPGLNDSAKLAAVSPRELGAEWLRARDPRERMRRQIALSGCSAALQARMTDSLARNPSRRLLGVVTGDSGVYAVHEATQGHGRLAPGVLPRAPIAAVLMQLRGAEWRVIPTRDLFGAEADGVAGLSCRK